MKTKILALRTFNKENSLELREAVAGYVLILTLTVIPILLLGAKYVLDNQTLLKRQTEGTEFLRNSSPDKVVKKCAQEAALAVAKKWNPGLSYKQQRERMLRIADGIYNGSAAYVDTTITQAISGIDIQEETITKGGTFEPLKVTKTASTTYPSTTKQIERTTNTTNMKRYYYYYSYSTKYAPMALYHFYIMRNSLTRANSNLFPPDEDLYTDYCYKGSGTGTWYHYVTWPDVVGMSSSDGLSQVSTRSYTTRKDLSDDTVKIEIESDKIKVTTDDDVAYAVPAESNVDIILAVPTNSAALNKDNYDKNTVTSGTPYVSTSTTPTTDAKSTPIYQITHAYQTFLKNFFHTRGVNVGVIPYSGNVSLYSDRSGWVKAPNSFVSTDFLNGTYQPGIVGAMLYGTTGTSNTGLTTTGSYAGNGISYGLLCRGNTLSFKGNTLIYGDLLSTTNPSSYQFRKMVYNPCYLTDGNLLSMKCEKTGSYYWMNPYFILEMNPDVEFMYNMLGAFYPYYDDRNVSNFIFIPVTWANNLLQSWSATGSNSATNTSSDTTNLGRLSTPSKTTTGRKKALILVVNKPDWFEPGELTYIGFDNDYSETPAVESDEIRFDKGKSQGQKGILVYTTQSGTMGSDYTCSSATGRLTYPQKWLLKVVVAPSSSSGTISFSNISTNSSTTTTGTQTITEQKEFYIIPSQMNGTYVEFAMTNIKLISAEITNRPYEMKDGVAEYKSLDVPERSIYIDLLKQALDGKLNYNVNGTDATAPNDYLMYGNNTSGDISNAGIKYGDGVSSSTSSSQSSQPVATVTINPDASENPTNWKNTDSLPIGEKYYKWQSVCYGGGKFVAVASNTNIVAYSDDGITWKLANISSTANWSSVCYGGGKFVAVAYDSSKAAYSSDGITWKSATMSSDSAYWESVCYGGGKFVAVAYDSDRVAYSDDGITWKFSTGIAWELWVSVCYGGGKFVATAYGSNKPVIYSSDGITWTEATLPSFTTNFHYKRSVCYGGGKFVMLVPYGDEAAYSEDGATWKSVTLPSSAGWW